ncbi:hypothetical protein A8A54_19230 [Brucella pseudogrignonensis]|nr:hypothetical protein A8A54_19230 [Brucella pseudogrignonensis]
MSFQITPAKSSFALSISTITLSAGLVVTGLLSDWLGRKPIMAASMFAAGILTIIGALIHNWTAFLVCRALLGLVLGGITAINMTYLAEEVHPKHMGYAMGLMIEGNSIGGMLSRLVVGVASEYVSWRYIVAMLGVLTTVAAVILWYLLPQSRHFTARPLSLSSVFSGFSLHLKNPLLRTLFVIGFLMMGSFVAFFNYVLFHLMEVPLNLSQAAVGWLSLVYILSTITSTKIGSLADRFGSDIVLLASVGVTLVGLLLTVTHILFLVVLSIATFTCGFFGAHSTVSSWIGRSTRQARAQATALYQIFFYLGASVAGTLGGLFWQVGGWIGVCAMMSSMLLVSVGLAMLAKLTKPLSSS